MLNEKKCHEQSADHGPDAFEDVNLSNGGDVFSGVLGIELAALSEEGAQGKCHREEYQKRGIENWCKAECLSRSSEEDIFEYSGEVNSKG